MLSRAAQGRIINIGSTAGFIGDRFLAVYSAAKGGVHAFTRVLALELGGGQLHERGESSVAVVDGERPVKRVDHAPRLAVPGDGRGADRVGSGDVA